MATDLGDASFAARLQALIAAAPGRVSITSGKRSPARQKQLWEAALKKYGDPEIADNYVARPGGSNHEKGLAGDLKYASDSVKQWVHANAARFGLNFPLGNEPWHVEPVEARGKTLSGSAVKAGFAPISVGPSRNPAPGQAAAAQGQVARGQQAPPSVMGPTGSDPSLLGADGKVDAGKAVAKYGYIAELAKAVPDIDRVMKQAISEGWEPQRFQAEIQRTPWWRTTSESQRSNELLKKTNPGEYRRRRQQKIDQINLIARRLGVPEGSQRVFILAERFLSMGTTDQEIERLVAADARVAGSGAPGAPAAGAGNTGETAVTVDALRGMARSQQVDLDPRTEQQWVAAVMKGDLSVDAYKSFLLAEAKKRNPDIPAAAFERGETVDSYRQKQSALVEQMRAESKQFLVPLSEDALKKWAGQVASGDVTPESFSSYIKEQAKSLFPTLGAAIDRGVTVAQYAEPYRQVAAQTLEINPDDVDFSNPMYSRALMQVDPKTGERTSMGLAEYQEYLRKQPQWQKTRQANEQAASLTESLLRTFGKTA